MAIIGLGDMNENSFMVQLGWFTPQEIATARQEQGVVGDLAGYSFFNIQGKPVDTVMNDRVIGLSLEQLRAIPLRHRYRLRKYESDGDPGGITHRGYRCAGYQRLERPFGH